MTGAGRKSPPRREPEVCRIDEEKLAEFDRAILGNMTFGEIARSMHDRMKNGALIKRDKMRAPIKLTVTVNVESPDTQSTAAQSPLVPQNLCSEADIDGESKEIPVSLQNSGDGAFAAAIREQQTFSELRDVTLDSRMRFFSFCENTRPPYRGTWSKVSTIITGRRPFHRDEERLNYEQDSEAEWEEEEEAGEDIGLSDEEEDGCEDNDLVYDEFFKRDDEETSDLDSDGEGMASARISRRQGPREILGPHFILATTSCASSSSDAAHALMQYQAIRHDADSFMECTDGDIIFNDDSAPRTDGAPGTARGEGAEAGEEKKPRIFPEHLVSVLAKLVNGKKDGVDKLVDAFVIDNPSVPKAQVKKKIQEVASRSRHPDGYGCQRWVVKADLCEALGVGGIYEVPFTPPKGEKKSRPKKKGGESSSSEPTVTPQDMTAALSLVIESLPTTADAAKYIVKNWEILGKTIYPWTLLWPRLVSLGWGQEEAHLFTLSSCVIVPDWAADKYKACGKKPSELTRNRDYFIDQDDVRNYILKYGVSATDLPPTPGRSRKREQQESSSLTESPYLKVNHNNSTAIEMCI